MLDSNPRHLSMQIYKLPQGFYKSLLEDGIQYVMIDKEILYLRIEALCVRLCLKLQRGSWIHSSKNGKA